MRSAAPKWAILHPILSYAAFNWPTLHSSWANVKLSLPQNGSDRIPRVPSIFVPRNRIPILLRKGSEQNSESLMFRGTAGIPSEIPICSSYSVLRGIIFLVEIPNPSSESSWYPSGELWTVFGMAACMLSDETIKFFIVQWYLGGK
jgi:hypothetical protein